MRGNRKMKRKVVAVLLCGILATSTLVACGSSTENVVETTNAVEETEESDEDAKAIEEADVKEAEEKAAEEAAAKEAEADEAYNAGRTCLYGLDGQKKDLEAAYNYFEKALELGKIDANFYLGVLYDWEGYPENDPEKARSYYEAAGENPYAYISLGQIYYFGQEKEADQEKGKEYYDKAINLGCTDAYFGLGQMAQAEEDYATAMDNYMKEIEEGTEQLYIANSMLCVGSLYYSGAGVEQNYDTAIEWYEKAAKLNNTKAMYNIGWTYTQEGVANGQKAIEWYEMAAELNYSDAMASLGDLYRLGNLVEQDFSKAIEWYEKAAALNNSYAINELGYVYQFGEGVEVDYEKAFEYYEKAAELGNRAAMNNLTFMYFHGEGLEANPEKALEWAKKSAELGDELGKQNVEYIESQLK